MSAGAARGRSRELQRAKPRRANLLLRLLRRGPSERDKFERAGAQARRARRRREREASKLEAREPSRVRRASAVVRAKLPEPTELPVIAKAQRAARVGKSVAARTASAPKRPRAAAPPRRVRTEAERREHSRKMRLLRRRLRLVAIAALVVAAVIAFYKVPRMEIFAVRQVWVVGASAVPDPMIRNQADKLLEGQTIYTVDREALAERVGRLPFVHQVKVERHLPGGISIEVSEYSPLAYGFSGNKGWLVARDGRVLVRAELEDWRERVPVVQLEQRGVKAGDRVGNEPALRMLRAMPATFPGAFRAVELNDRGFIGSLHDGPDVRFGRDADLPEKLLVAQRMLTLYGHSRRESIEYIDVSVPARPAVKMRE